jgi:pimeloyl-ACP methyl ester carboxylesterase
MVAWIVLAALAVGLGVLLLLPGWTPAIEGGSGKALAVLEQVPVGETRQWVLIRTEDTSHPVVLFVHGGPGTSQLTLLRNATRPLERHFTVVNWDQRGAGKSFGAGADESGMTMARFVEDLADLSASLARRFQQRKILLVGHSWGSALGVLAVKQRPELFSAYVGIGQVARMAEGEAISYAWTLAQAERAGDRRAVRALLEIGSPPYTGAWQSKFMTQRRLLGRFGGECFGSTSGAFGVVLRNLVLSTEYTLLDRIAFFRGIFRSVRLLLPELLRTDLFVQAPRLEVPVYFCLGRHDQEVPAALSERYFQALSAPAKNLIWFERSAHMCNTEEPEAFNAFMVETVLPSLR